MIWGWKRFIYACFDKQLYDVTTHVCWTQPRKFQNIVIHLACMYIIVIFCLHWNHNKMPSLGTVYGWIRGICNWKSWIKSMRLFQSVAAALLQQFLSIRQITFDGIEQYSKQLIYIQLQFPPANTPDSPVWAHRVERWCPIETAEDEVSDEVFLLCLIWHVFTLHYLLFDWNAKTILI